MQDVAKNPKNIYRSGRLKFKPSVNDPDYIEKFKAWCMGKDLRIGKSGIKHTGKHICILELTALGNVITNDTFSYEDEDIYHNGNITEGLVNILEREDNDPYIKSVGKYLHYIQDANAIIARVKEPFISNVLAQYGILIGIKIDIVKTKKRLLIVKELYEASLEIKDSVIENACECDKEMIKTFETVTKYISTLETLIHKIEDSEKSF